MTVKIFPRNLPARAVVEVIGNPVVTRLESGVGNCYPGLEFDHRNLDRRFLPGLVFNFVSQNDAPVRDPERQGARLVAVLPSDPDLDPQARGLDIEEVAARHRVADALLGAAGRALNDRTETWYLAALEQANHRTSLRGDPVNGKPGQPLDGMVVWRMVRSLRPGPVHVWLERRGVVRASDTKAVDLDGWRRRFLNDAGLLKEVYAAGEMTQSLCSPWQHDFRDCDCTYWASNHPDIALGAATPGSTSLATGAPTDPGRALTPLDWLRADRDHAIAVPAAPDRRDNRPFQLDHYEINQRWQELSIVAEGREIDRVYQPRLADTAERFASPDELADHLVELATLEHVLILEYLYALYSLRRPAEVDAVRWAALPDHLVFVRHQLLQVAVSEMRHLRWANELLWRLEDLDLASGRAPALGVAMQVPATGGTTRPRALRSLTPETLVDFIAVEAPSMQIDGQYARVVATLRDTNRYPPSLHTIAAQIVADGSEHYTRFREIAVVLSAYQDATAYLRPMNVAAPDHPAAAAAVSLYREIVATLVAPYRDGIAGPAAANAVSLARRRMIDLDGQADALAAAGIGLPLF